MNKKRVNKEFYWILWRKKMYDKDALIILNVIVLFNDLNING